MYHQQPPPPAAPEPKDDLNKYLTWGNMLKVLLFICTPIFMIAQKDAADKSRDLEIKNINIKLEEIKISIDNNNKKTLEEYKEMSERINNLEKKVEIISYELKNPNL